MTTLTHTHPHSNVYYDLITDDEVSEMTAGNK